MWAQASAAPAPARAGTCIGTAYALPADGMTAAAAVAATIDPAQYVGAIVMFSDDYTLGMVQSAERRNGQIAMKLALNPAMGWGTRQVDFALLPNKQPGQRLRLGPRAQEFGRLIGAQL